MRCTERALTPPVVSGGWLYLFGFSTSLQRRALFRTDGTSSAYTPIADVGVVDGAAVSGGKVFWSAPLFPSDGSYDTGLYVTDGTAAGTTLLHAFTGTTWNQGHVGAMTDVNGTLMFWAHDDTNGLAIWKSDGTAAGTMKVASIPSGVSAGGYIQPQAWISAGGKFFLTAADSNDPSRLMVWVSDGTAAGTRPLIQSVPGLEPLLVTGFQNLVNINGIVYFVSDQLWRSDGTPAGTYPVSPVGRGVSPVYSSNIPSLNHALIDQSGSNFYFSVDDGTHGEELYSLPAGYAPPLAQILPPDQGAEGGPIDQITIRFNRAVDNLQVRDLLLSHDGVTNLLSGSETLTTSDHITWTLGNLLPDTFAPGTYTLSLIPGAGDVVDAQGDPVANYAQQSFTVMPGHVVAGAVFNDANHDGVRDPGEAGLNGWTVYLDIQNTGFFEAQADPTALTHVDGRYVFTNAPAGTYVVREVLPAGWRRTTPIASAATVSVATDQQAYGPVFGNVQISTVPMNFDYLLTLAQHYGQTGTFASGDVTGDDTINFDDLLLVAQNYGHTLPGAAGSAQVQVAALSDLDSTLHPHRGPARARVVR